MLVTAAVTGCSASAADQADDGSTAPRLRVAAAASLALAAPLSGLNDSPALSGEISGVTTTPVATPDEFKSLLTSSRVDLAALPTITAANLHNRGVGISLVGVVDADLLKVLAPKGSSGWDSLRGRTVYVPFQGDAGDVTFRKLAEENGLTPGEDFQLAYTRSIPELMSAVATGKARYALLPEHFATLALRRAPAEQAGLAVLLDVQREWRKATGAGSLPQSAIVVRSEFAEDHPELVAKLRSYFTANTEDVADGDLDRTRAAELAKATGITADLVSALLPTLHLSFTEPRAARSDITTLLTEAADLSPRSVGGKLPDGAFYGE
ncbi:PhnD/SsuA/transferrin family substrate-binding protein [Streptomyces antibioticus]|uniref:ABC transporter substrate-binding protein n=1 Tax=Streptomyces antibioticus TaxID=1890 RepID=UPI002257DC10|nr:PhnD/SsuA/transferrin family substrate-binding protein [Streptomyces antibioticus]MCX5173461.1 PhnD/SsuA/transferrin family substrate-binding protein [Streptomyces antibioticus]